jgi:uncharacterized Ntn-hydrolase superfamily protein
MTFSIAARLPGGSHFGIAICSSSPAVAARCAHARAGIGAVATQNITDPSLGPQVLGRMAAGSDPARALDATLSGTPFAAYRQLLVVGSNGAPQLHSGARALGIVASAIGEHAVAAGNLLENAGVPAAMLRGFEATSGSLDERLMAALRCGLAQGGEAGPVHSAGLLIVRDQPWPLVDLRVDWSETDPVSALADVWRIYSPQMEDYVQRAVNPAAAPGFGVPGDP